MERIGKRRWIQMNWGRSPRDCVLDAIRALQAHHGHAIQTGESCGLWYVVNGDGVPAQWRCHVVLNLGDNAKARAARDRRRRAIDGRPTFLLAAERALCLVRPEYVRRIWHDHVAFSELRIVCHPVKAAAATRDCTRQRHRRHLSKAATQSTEAIARPLHRHFKVHREAQLLVHE